MWEGGRPIRRKRGGGPKQALDPGHKRPDQIRGVHRSQAGRVVVACSGIESCLAGHTVVAGGHIVEDARRRTRGICPGAGIAIGKVLGRCQRIENVVRKTLPPARLLVDDRHDTGERRRCRGGSSYNSGVKKDQVAVAVGCGLAEALETHQIAVMQSGGSQGDIRNIALPILWYPWNRRVLPTGFAVNLARASAAGKEIGLVKQTGAERGIVAIFVELGAPDGSVKRCRSQTANCRSCRGRPEVRIVTARRAAISGRDKHTDPLGCSLLPESVVESVLGWTQ